jgi:hypothetical protein
MLPIHFLYEAQIKRQEFERESRQRMLVRLTRGERGNPGTFERDLVVRFGRWLVVQGEYLEARYGECTESMMPLRSTANVR